MGQGGFSPFLPPTRTLLVPNFLYVARLLFIVSAGPRVGRGGAGCVFRVPNPNKPKGKGQKAYAFPFVRVMAAPLLGVR
jgi:hypothetical protein